MNEQEVIKIIDETSCKQRNCNKCDQYRKELEKYREIGTVEACREAVKKQTAKKPITYPKTNRADCPSCGKTVRGIKNPFGDWCSHCGQRLDWSVEE